MPTRDFSKARRIVIKLGTGVLTERGHFDAIHFARLTADLADIAKNHELTLVSSGAVALGMGRSVRGAFSQKKMGFLRPARCA